MEVSIHERMCILGGGCSQERFCPGTAGLPWMLEAVDFRVTGSWTKS